MTFMPVETDGWDALIILIFYLPMVGIILLIGGFMGIYPDQSLGYALIVPLFILGLLSQLVMT